MVMPIAWVLNLDADDELRRPAGYTPSAATVRRVQRFAARLLGLVRPGDVVLEPELAANGPVDGAEIFPSERSTAFSQPPATRDIAGSHHEETQKNRTLRGPFVGQAWCPTPSALARLRRAGALVPPTPSLEVLRHVNHRAFCAGLGQTLQQARYVRSYDELLQHVNRLPPSTWILKRPHGFSGRGSRRVRFPHPDPSDRRWIEATLKYDEGLQAEPWVHRLRDFAIHGYLEETGVVHLGDPTVQECGPKGDWRRTRLAAPDDLLPVESRSLLHTAQESLGALLAAGYFGPFGIDAYRWSDERGSEHFNPRSEINARYTMGWHVGMGDWRPSLRPGET